MNTFMDSIGGRKMTLGLAAIVAVVILSTVGDLPSVDAVGAIWKIVAAVAGGIAVEDGLKARGAQGE